MKFSKYIFFYLFTLICLTQNASGQAELFIPNLPTVSEISTYQYNVIINIPRVGSDTSDIVMYDTNVEDSQGVTIFSAEGSVRNHAVQGEHLYFSLLKSDESTLEVLDLLNLEEDPTSIFLEGYIPLRLSASDDRLFIIAKDSSSANAEFDFLSLLELPLDSLEKEPFVIADSLALRNLKTYNDNLFYMVSKDNGGKDLYKYDTQIEFVASISGAINDLAIWENNIYFSNATISINDKMCKGEILSLDLTKIEEGVSIFSEEFSAPFFMDVLGSYLYVFEAGFCFFTSNQVSRINLEEVMVSTTNFQEENSLVLYPNPTADMLHLQDKTGVYSIFNLLGQKILSGNLSLGSAIDVNAISSGWYIILFEDGTTARFQKFNPK